MNVPSTFFKLVATTRRYQPERSSVDYAPETELMQQRTFQSWNLHEFRLFGKLEELDTLI